MKKIIALVVALIMTVGMAAVASADKLSDIQASGKLLVGSGVSFPPYEFWYSNPETGEEELAGFDMRLAQAIADKLGVELEVSDQAFAGLLTALSVGELDMVIGGVSIKPEREEIVDFSKPYFTGTQVLVARAEDAESFKTVEDLAGKKIGAQLGSLQQTILEEQFPDSGEELLEKVPLLMMELMSGEVDAVLVVDTVALQYITAYDNAIAITEVPVVYEGAGVGVCVQKGDNEALLALVNELIDEVTADGTFAAWVDEEAAKAASTLEIQ